MDIETATTDQLIEALKARFDDFVFVGRPVGGGERRIGLCVRHHGFYATLIGGLTMAGDQLRQQAMEDSVPYEPEDGEGGGEG